MSEASVEHNQKSVIPTTFLDRASNEKVCRPKNEKEFIDALVMLYPDLRQACFSLVPGKYYDKQTEAEDLAQTVCQNALRSYKTYHGDSSFLTWLIAIAQNAAKDKYNRKLRTRKYPDRDLWQGDTLQDAEISGKLKPAHPNMEKLIDNKRRLALIRESLTHLSARDRKIFLMRYFEEMQIDEIAERLSMKKDTIKVILLRTRQKLPKIMNYANLKQATMRANKAEENNPGNG